MNLTKEKIQELYKSPTNKAHIQAAGIDNAWQSFHSRPSTSSTDAGAYYGSFTRKVKEILSYEKKFKIFEKLLSFPLPSQQIVSKATDEWNKIFSAQDRTIEFNFDDEQTEQDFVDYLSEIALSHIVEQNIVTAVKQSVNTIAVVDLPSRGEPSNDKYVRPYTYLVDITAVIDADENYKRQLEYLIFKTGTGDQERIIAIDDTHYRVFRDVKGELTFEREEPHNLGYCPATTIWFDNIDNRVPVRRFNAVIESLTDFDRLVMAEVFSEHVDLYAAFPFLWRYVMECQYEIDGNHCSGGVINISDSNGNTKPQPCPSCASRGMIGPGTIMDMPLPADKDQPVIGAPAGFIEPGTDNPEYIKKKIHNLCEKIERQLTGGTLTITNREAMNEDQIRSQYDARQSVLMYWAENFQKCHKFLIDTIGKLRYGDKYQGSTVNYGTDFFLIDINIAVNEYQEARNAGLPMYIVSQKREVVEGVFARMSPDKRERMEILKQLEPYLDVPLSQIDKESEEYKLKANFSTYIQRFERENGPVTVFGRKTTPLKRISKIQSKLYGYVKENTNVRKSGQRKEAPV